MRYFTKGARGVGSTASQKQSKGRSQQCLLIRRTGKDLRSDTEARMGRQLGQPHLMKTDEMREHLPCVCANLDAIMLKRDEVNTTDIAKWSVTWSEGDANRAMTQRKKYLSQSNGHLWTNLDQMTRLGKQKHHAGA